jgi:hypothetical protein
LLLATHSTAAEMSSRRKQTEDEERDGLLRPGATAAVAAAQDKEDEQFAYNSTAYFIMLFLGLALLLPWNVVLNACVDCGRAEGRGWPTNPRRTQQQSS